MTCRWDGRFRRRLPSRVGRLLLLAFAVRLAAAIFTAFVPSKFKASPPDAKRSLRAATLSEAVVDETGPENSGVGTLSLVAVKTGF